jgi:hypothetical protein
MCCCYPGPHNTVTDHISSRLTQPYHFRL